MIEDREEKMEVDTVTVAMIAEEEAVVAETEEVVVIEAADADQVVVAEEEETAEANWQLANVQMSK